MRLAINLIKLVGLIVFATAAFAASALVATMHYAGISDGLTLLRVDTAGLGEDALFGWLFQGLGGNFANWAALSITLLIFFSTFFVSLLLFQVIRLAVEAPQLIAEGRGLEVRQTLIIQTARLIILIVPLAALLAFDASLFQYRGLVGVSGISDASLAAQSVQSLRHADRALASIDLIGGWGVAGYVAATALAALLFEVVLGRIYETLFAIGALINEDAAEDEVIDVGYDTSEAATPGPPTPSAQQSDSDDAPAPVSLGAASPGLANEAGAEPLLLPVIGGHDDEAVSLDEARANPRRWHVSTNPRAVFTRKHWEALQAEADEEETA